MRDELRKLDLDMHKQKVQMEKLRDENEDLKQQHQKLEEALRESNQLKQKYLSDIEDLRNKEYETREKLGVFEHRVAEAHAALGKARTDMEKERAAFQITARRLKVCHSCFGLSQILIVPPIPDYPPKGA